MRSRRLALALAFAAPIALALSPTSAAPPTGPLPTPRAPATSGHAPIRGGYVLTHEHPTNAMAFGGNYAFTGATGNFKNGIMEKGYTAECGGCQVGKPCDHAEVKGTITELLGLGKDMGPHRSHKGPLPGAFSHARYSTEWIKEAHDGLGDTKLKLMVAFAVENEAMCEQLYYANKGKGGPGGDGYPCTKGDSLESLERQLSAMKAWARENASWAEIAYSAADARRIIEADKLAVVLGIEAEYAFGAEDRTFDPVSRLQRYWDDGVRTFYLAHKINSRLSGADIYRAKDTDPGKAMRTVQAISGCFYYDDNVGQFPLRNRLGHKFCDNNCGKNAFKGDKLTDACATKLSDISEANMFDYVMTRGGGEFDGFNVYPKPPGFLPENGTTGAGSTVGRDGVERNNLGLSHDGERVVREAMTKGMIVNIDHTSSNARRVIKRIATQDFGGYPLNALHNSPNAQLHETNGLLGGQKTPGPHEYDFDDDELAIVADTGGFFGLRVGPFASKPYDASGVTASCPQTSTEAAKFLAYLLDKKLPVGYALDYATTTEGVFSRTSTKCSLPGKDWLQSYSPSETAEGLTHVGMMKYWHKELEAVGLKAKYLDALRNDGVEAFLRMWEKSEAKKGVGRQIARQTFTLPTSSGTCSEDSSCANGEFCTAGIPDFKENVCKPKKEHGATCSTKRQCLSDRCSWGICADPDECRDAGDCPSGQYCGDPIAGKAKCKDKLDKGKACTKDMQCKSGACSLFFCK